MNQGLPATDGDTLRGLGVTAKSDAVFLYYRKGHAPSTLLRVSSSDGFNFSKKPVRVELKDRQRRPAHYHRMLELRISQAAKQFVAMYLYGGRHERQLYCATSE